MSIEKQFSAWNPDYLQTAARLELLNIPPIGEKIDFSIIPPNGL
jgi:hypothetical protein